MTTKCIKGQHPALYHGTSEAVGCFGTKLTTPLPDTGCQKLPEVDDDKPKLCTFHEKHMAEEVAVDALDEEWKGYVVQSSGANDK